MRPSTSGAFPVCTPVCTKSVPPAPAFSFASVAALYALSNIADDDTVLVLYGDVPLTRLETLQQLLAVKPANGLAILTVNLANPSGYGRIVRDEQGNLVVKGSSMGWSLGAGHFRANHYIAEQ